MHDQDGMPGRLQHLGDGAADEPRAPSTITRMAVPALVASGHAGMQALLLGGGAPSGGLHDRGGVQHPAVEIGGELAETPARWLPNLAMCYWNRCSTRAPAAAGLANSRSRSAGSSRLRRDHLPGDGRCISSRSSPQRHSGRARSLPRRAACGRPCLGSRVKGRHACQAARVSRRHSQCRVRGIPGNQLGAGARSEYPMLPVA
jgi:hypothetical protein